MITTKTDAYSVIEAMSEEEFSALRNYMNGTLKKSSKRVAAEKRFVAEVTAAQKSVDAGNYVTLNELHEFLGV